MQEGSIKFNCNWIKNAPLHFSFTEELNAWRGRLYTAKLIGENKDGIGYGNISTRFRGNRFIISGSATGKLPQLTNEHYTVVTDFNIDNNSLTAEGPVIASSESLTHAIIYYLQPHINAVMHVHHFNLWKKLLDRLPSAGNNAEYGTPAMAKEIERLFKESNLAAQKIFAMAGHEEGIVSFGKDLNEAGEKIFSLLDEV